MWRGTFVGRAALLAAVAAGTFWLAGGPASSGLAADKDEAPKAEAGLDLVPADGVAAFSVRFADLWNHAAFKAARDRLVKDLPEVAEHFTKEVGVGPDEIERITGLMPSLESHGNLLVFVTTKKPYDAKKLLAAAIPDLAEEKIKERTSFARPTGGAIALLDDRTFMTGPEDEVRAYLKQTEPAKDGPLAPVLREAAGEHLLVAGLDTEMLAKVASHDTSAPAAEALKPLLKARSALLTVDLGEDLKAEARLTFAGESDAKAGEEAADSALDLARSGMVMELQEAKKLCREWAGSSPSWRTCRRALRSAKVETKASWLVTATMTVKIDPEKTGPT